jgi:uroporphyrinogen-III decarboxylase
MIGHPLVDDKVVARYTGPDPNRLELYKEAAQVIRDFKEEYWIVGVTVTTIFETAWALRGYEQMLMDFVANPDLAEHILNIPYQYHLTAAKKLVEMGVDIVVRPKSWTLGIINSGGPRKERTDEETPQVHTRVQGPSDT